MIFVSKWSTFVPGIFGHHRNVRLHVLWPHVDARSRTERDGTNLTILEFHVEDECPVVNPQSDVLSSCVVFMM